MKCVYFQGIPILRDSSGVLLCNTHSVNRIGDHSVWYGNITHAYKNGHVMEPMLYYHRCVWYLSPLDNSQASMFNGLIFSKMPFDLLVDRSEPSVMKPSFKHLKIRLYHLRIGHTKLTSEWPGITSEKREYKKPFH